MKHIKGFRQLLENNTVIHDYAFDKALLSGLIANARKWRKEDFVEEYVYYNDITLMGVHGRINKGDKVEIARNVRDSSGKNMYVGGMQAYAPYKTVVAAKDYGDSHWQFIMDNTAELQEEAAAVYDANKSNTKPRFGKRDVVVRAYHASPFRFKQFMYGVNDTSGQIGAGTGFFFFKDRKNAEFYASVLSDNRGVAYLYECDVRLGNTTTEEGVEVGTNWGRAAWLEQAEAEGYDSVTITDADTGYGITDELVVFDDDNIKIRKVTEINEKS